MDKKINLILMKYRYYKVFIFSLNHSVRIDIYCENFLISQRYVSLYCRGDFQLYYGQECIAFSIK